VRKDENLGRKEETEKVYFMAIEVMDAAAFASGSFAI
jgi:hypothetical protein